MTDSPPGADFVGTEDTGCLVASGMTSLRQHHFGLSGLKACLRTVRTDPFHRPPVSCESVILYLSHH